MVRLDYLSCAFVLVSYIIGGENEEGIEGWVDVALPEVEN